MTLNQKIDELYRLVIIFKGMVDKIEIQLNGKSK